MKKLAVMFLIMVALGGVAGYALVRFGGTGLRGDGVIRTEERAIPAFSQVEVNGAFEVQWASGPPALSISADQNLLAHIKTVVEGDTLHVHPDVSLRPTQGIHVVLASAALNGADLKGAVQFVADRISGQHLQLVGSGAVTISANGRIDEMDVNLTGASRLDAARLKSKKAKVTLTGASSADVAASEALQAHVTGAAALTYYGNPQSVDKSAIGAATIRRHP